MNFLVVIRNNICNSNSPCWRENKGFPSKFQYSSESLLRGCNISIYQKVVRFNKMTRVPHVLNCNCKLFITVDQDKTTPHKNSFILWWSGSLDTSTIFALLFQKIVSLLLDFMQNRFVSLLDLMFLYCSSISSIIFFLAHSGQMMLSPSWVLLCIKMMIERTGSLFFLHDFAL